MSIEIKVMDKQQIAQFEYIWAGIAEGYYVTRIEPDQLVILLEGPIIDQQYAIHRAVNVHGMEAPAGFNPSAAGDGLL